MPLKVSKLIDSLCSGTGSGDATVNTVSNALSSVTAYKDDAEHNSACDSVVVTDDVIHWGRSLGLSLEKLPHHSDCVAKATREEIYKLTALSGDKI